MSTHKNSKRIRVGDSVNQPKLPIFSTGRDVQHFFHSDAVSVDGLKAFRNQISLKPGEDSVTSHDGRLLLVKDWLENAPGAQDIFSLIERGSQPATTALCVSILSCVLSLTSAHFVYQPLGSPIIKRLLSAQWMRKLNGYLTNTHMDLCPVTLKLLNAISGFAGGKEQKALMEAFSWDVKLFQKMLYMRRKGKNTDHSDMLQKPDIRTLCLQLTLSFLSSQTSSYVKTLLLEQHRDIFLSIFRGLSTDPYPVVRHVLEALWTDLWQDQKIKRSLKVGLFGETTIQHLLKLYDRGAQEGDDSEHVPADIVHHFLLATCTHRGVGVCFVDCGWYPRLNTDGEGVMDIEEGRGVSGGTRQKGGKLYNKILANVLKMLKVNDDARQQELALKILQACPELVVGYLQSAGLTLEPRLSSKWLANISFIGSVVTLPVPFESFFLPAGTPGSSSSPAQYQPAPPPLTVIVENILPSVNLKVHLSKALQAPSALVQHTAGLALAKCLLKCERVLDAFRAVERALEEDNVGGQWTRRRHEVEREVRKRAPEFQVVIAFWNASRPPNAGEGCSSVKTALLSELAQRLLWLYHRCLPSLLAEARYDVGKSLQMFLELDGENLELSEEVKGLKRLQQLHVLKMLRESDTFIWNAKAGPSTPSNIHILLKLYVKSQNDAIREALLALMKQALRESLLFQHDSEELQLWLEALPTSVRIGGAEGPDGVPLTDESESVVPFLDECMQRFAKTPYRYLEELDSLAASLKLPPGGPNDDVLMEASVENRATGMSPVVVTFLEQLAAKVKNNLLSPSDVLALVSYLRKVVVSLLGKQSDLALSRAIAAKLSDISSGSDVLSASQVIRAAIQKELGILNACLGRCAPSTAMGPETQIGPLSSTAVQDFVLQVERLVTPEGSDAKVRAYELVDWLRLVDQTLDSEIIGRVIAVIRRLHTPALTYFLLHLSPESNPLWPSIGDGDVSCVSLDWLILHVATGHLQLTRVARVLSEALSSRHNSLYSYDRYCGILMHRLPGQSGDNISHVLVTILLIVRHAKVDLSPSEFVGLKNFLLAESTALQKICYDSDLSAPASLALHQLIEVMLDSKSDFDRSLASPICKTWLAYVTGAIYMPPSQPFSHVLPWIKFMSCNDVLSLAERALQILQSRQNTGTLIDADSLALLKELLTSIVRYEGSTASTWLGSQLPGLLLLQQHLPSVAVLQEAIARSVNAAIPLGLNGLMISPPLASLSSVSNSAQTNWESRLSPLAPNASINDLLCIAHWPPDIRSAVAGFMYKSSEARDGFWQWLISGDLTEKPDLISLAPAIHAYFDSTADEEFGTRLSGESEHKFVENLFAGLADSFVGTASESYDADVFMASLLQIIRCNPTRRKNLFGILQKAISQISVHTTSRTALRMALTIDKLYAEESKSYSQAIIEHALQWAVRHLSETTNSVALETSVLKDLTTLISGKQIAAHYAEPVVSAAISHHILHPVVMRLTEKIFSSITLKPVNVNRHLQGILQHQQLQRIAAAEASSPAREAVVKFLYALFHAHPANTCQPSHIQPLVQLYAASLSTADRHLLAIFRLFETRRKTAVTSIFSVWSPSGPLAPQTYLDVIANLDPSRIFRTCLNFPVRRMLVVDIKSELTAPQSDDALLYDPVFVVLLFAQALVEGPPRSALAWVQLYRSNIVSLIIRCLSSSDPALRTLAAAQLSSLWKCMQSADMQEKDHVIYMLNLLREQLPALSDEPPVRLASYTTLLLAHALRGVFYPSNFIYPITARFLLQRAELDTQDVPLLYGLLYSSADAWRKERGWMVRFLADGMLSSEDWHLLKRRHTWDLLATLYQSSPSDRTLCHGILEVLANLTCHPQATTSLVLKSSLIQWMEMQLLTVQSDESIAWAKIVENILVVVDADKIEQATKGEWRAGLLRCLVSLLRGADINLLRLIARAMVRLAVAQLIDSSSLTTAALVALSRLIEFENAGGMVIADLPSHDIDADEFESANLPTHRSHGLHHLQFAHDLVSWGDTVESLWNVCMACESKGEAWDRLSSRLLVWRSIVGESRSAVGEWARRQSVNLVRGNHAEELLPCRVD